MSAQPRNTFLTGLFCARQLAGAIFENGGNAGDIVRALVEELVAEDKLIADDIAAGRPTPEDIAAGAEAYAIKAGRIAAEAFVRGAEKMHGKKNVDRDIVDIFAVAYRKAMREAYNVGARAALRMAKGDFSVEPWTETEQ